MSPMSEVNLARRKDTLGQVKNNNWLASFFQKFYGREGGFYLRFFFFDSEVLMLKYNTTNSDFYQVLPSQNSIETFLKKNYENKK